MLVAGMASTGTSRRRLGRALTALVSVALVAGTLGLEAVQGGRPGRTWQS